jgi:hypothetical protein
MKMRYNDIYAIGAITPIEAQPPLNIFYISFFIVDEDLEQTKAYALATQMNKVMFLMLQNILCHCFDKDHKML